MSRTTFACNGASVKGRRSVQSLDYWGPGEHRVRIGLPSFVTDLLHLPDRYLDLLEIAAYVFAADRSVQRGCIDAVEYQSWAREIDIHVRIRDEQFWKSDRNLGSLLAEALNWMTGDEQYRFYFSGGHRTPPVNLFDAARVSLPKPSAASAVLLFSGGLDSLAGALTLLDQSDKHLVLVSHQSQSRMKRTQDALVRALQAKYHGRISHYPFECTLSGDRGKEETQRSRSFLYSSIAATIALVHDCSSIYVFENGVTSLNFARRQDLMNARASRTTHPQTIGRLARFLSAFADRNFTIEDPFLWKTKADIVKIVADLAPELLSSSVSCTSTFNRLGPLATHCGECFQCIDRRLAAFAVNRQDLDHSGLYSVDLIDDSFTSGSSRTTVVDFLRQAAFFRDADSGEFEGRYLKELAELLDWIPGVNSDLQVTENVHSLMTRHGKCIFKGINAMRESRDDVFREQNNDNLLHLLSIREHLRPEIVRLADSLETILREALPRMFRKERPKNENDLNAKINALLATHHDKLRSEHPVARFACSTVIPDHDLGDTTLLLEAKYIRAGTPPAKASEGISSDLVKYPKEAFILFVVLDLDDAVSDDRAFTSEIEAVRPCRVTLIH